MSRRAVPALLLVGVLGSGCGLPLVGGVRDAGRVDAEQRLPEPIEVLPPGPQPGAGPRQVVEGFLAAQGSSRGNHAIAREFLAEPQRQVWEDDAQVRVHLPTRADYDVTAGGNDATVTQTIDLVGQVAADGSATMQPPGVRQSLTLRYRLSKLGDAWRIVEAPEGLTLSPADRARTFTAFDVHFVAPAPPGAPATHLVADRRLLPADGDTAQQLVEQLLAGPSAGLGDSVGTAVPAGATLLRPVTVSADGEVVVDLSAQVDDLPDQLRQQLSAQLVWTLRGVPGFARLRLLVAGRALLVAGSDDPQRVGSWQSFDPDGQDRQAPGYVLAGGRVQQLGTPGDRPRDEPPPLTGVSDAAVDPRGDTLALLRGPAAAPVLLVGPLAGPLVPRTPLGPVVSPSWGSGEHGLWLLRTGGSPALLVAPTQGAVREVAATLPRLGPSPLLRVSRDGVRVALVADGWLYVGRLETDDGGRPVRLVALRALRDGVLDASWQTGTSLAVLVRDEDPPLLPLLRLSVDGTSAVESGLLGVGVGDPVALAAFRDQPLLVETTLRRTSTTYGEDGNLGFQVVRSPSRRPFYPG